MPYYNHYYNEFNEEQLLEINDYWNYFYQVNDLYSIYHFTVRDNSYDSINYYNYYSNNIYGENILYLQDVILTNIKINTITYINNNIIQFANAACNPGNINIKDKQQENTITNDCSFDKGIISCNIPENINIGKYYVCYGDRDINPTYITKKFEEGNINFDLTELQLGTNEIILTSNDIILKLINKIVIFDNNNNHKTI
jgi:hypothetical protein